MAGRPAGVGISISLTGLDYLLPELADIVALAPEIEACGADQLTVSEHVAMAGAIVGYPYGTYPSTADANWFEPVAMLGAVAALTRRVRLSTSILIAPLRSAPLLAKQLATLDQLSGGRLEIGLGTGWQRAEYAASGIPFEGRLKRLDEQVRAMQALWRGAPARFAGETVAFDDLYSLPHPRQAGGVPIIFGLAPTPANIARMVAQGAGWAPWFGIPAPGSPDRRDADLAALREGAGRLHSALAAAGRDPSGFVIRTMPQPEAAEDGRGYALEPTLERAAAYVEAGATTLEFAPGLFAPTAGEIMPIIARVLAWRDERFGGNAG